MGDQTERQFPIVYSFDGAPSADGTALLVEATGFDGSVMRFAIPIDNVKHFIAFLLVWIGTISASRENGDDAEVAGGSTLPIPATSIAIGEPSGPRRADLFLAAFVPRANRANAADGGRWSTVQRWKLAHSNAPEGLVLLGRAQASSNSQIARLPPRPQLSRQLRSL